MTARLFGAVAIGTALIGLLFTAKTMAGFTPLVALNTEAQGRSLSVWVTSAEMLQHEHSKHDHGDDDQSATSAFDAQNAGAQGFAMAPSMSPGTPEDGFQRLQIELDVMNREAVRAAIQPQDFLLTGSDDLTWQALRGGTFSRTELGSMEILNTVVAFDIPAGVAQDNLELLWVGDGQDIHFSVGESEGHDHE